MKVKKASRWDPTSVPTFWINQASRAVQRRFEQDLRPLGFGMAYLPVVVALEENGPLLQKDLADLAWVEQPTMAALLTRMERDGLIARQPHPDDKRASLISLTAAAKARLPLAKQQLLEGAEQALSGISQRERTTLIDLLRRVLENLGEDLQRPR